MCNFKAQEHLEARELILGTALEVEVVNRQTECKTHYSYDTAEIVYFGVLHIMRDLFVDSHVHIHKSLPFCLATV